MFTSKHNPRGATLHCDNGRIESLIAEYQSTGDIRTLASIIDLTQDRALTLIRFHKTTRYRREDELLSDVNLKLLKAIGKFNPAKGSAFSFLSHVIFTTLRTCVTTARKHSSQYVEFDEAAASKLITNGETQSRDAIDDLAYRIRFGVKSTVTDPGEADMQRWYVDSFIDGAFELRRHQCANAAMAVYGVSHSRSRELYDLTMLELRRILYDDLKRRQPIAPGRLLGSRLAWMARYANLMNSDEVTKFVTLMRNLAPYLLLIINPENRKSHRLDRNPAIGRRNVELIINGDPDATPLFNENISDDKVTITGDFS